ncbi:MAG TPA: hypothetical protein VF593_04125 [Chthoniobacteraceae bacterium]|jgi:hypothetical protein
MKILPLFGVMLVLQFAAQAADTAYSALRVYGKKYGEKALYRVVELRGRNGAPQPTVWRLIVDDPQARGGVREVEVQKGRIISERTPVGRDLGPTMNFNQLNLDSDGVFTIVNQEAAKRRVPFDRADYTLRSGSNGSAPWWQIDLFEGSARVGSVRIAADTGEVLQQDFSAPQRYAEDRAYLEEEPNVAPDRRRRRTVEEEERTVRIDVPRGVGKFFDRVGRHFQRRGQQVENFFTGRGGSRDDRDDREDRDLREDPDDER